MKRFWIVLLSLGLIMAVSASASALTIDTKGLVYYRGWYIDNPSIQDRSVGGRSTAHVDQRIRLWWYAKVADGLDFVMRMDWMEDKWAPNTALSAQPTGVEPVVALDWGYTRFRTVAGTFQIGLQPGERNWGTDLNNSGGAKPGIIWSYDIGALRIGANWQHDAENAAWTNIGTATDADWDIYGLRFNWDQKKGLDFGAQVLYVKDARNRPAAAASQVNAYSFEPYVKAKIGPIDLEAEGMWTWGDFVKKDNPTAASPDVKMEAKGYYVNAKVNMGPAYLGAQYIYMSGDDPATTDKREGNVAKGVFDGGSSLRADRMFFSGSDYYTKMVGSYVLPPSAGAAAGTTLTGSTGGDNNVVNLKSLGLYGGTAFSKRLSGEASVWLLKADVAKVGTTDFVSDEIGKEFAATANYKIFDNLAVQVDFAYLWAGDYWKGTNPAAQIGNNYFINSWLILDF